LVTDGVYRNLGHWHVKPHRKPRGGELTDEQVDENDVISETRGLIERKFGDQTSKFDIINKKFRHGEQRFNREFKTSM
jgi:hypothetical protein